MWLSFRSRVAAYTGINNKERHRTATRWPRAPLLHRDGRLIQVTNTAFVLANSGIFRHLYSGSLYFETYKYIDYVIPVEKDNLS